MDDDADTTPTRVMAPPFRWLAALLLAVACVVGMPVEHAPAAAAVEVPAIESSVVCEQTAPSTNATDPDAVRTGRRMRPCDDPRASQLQSLVDGAATSTAPPLMAAGRSWRGPPAPSRLV